MVLSKLNQLILVFTCQIDMSKCGYLQFINAGPLDLARYAWVPKDVTEVK